MTPSRYTAPPSDEGLIALGATGDIDISRSGLLPTRTEQVSVVLPAQHDDDLVDDEVMADEIGGLGRGVGSDIVESAGDEAEPLEAELVETGPHDGVEIGRGLVDDADAAVEVEVDPDRTPPPRGAAATEGGGDAAAGSDPVVPTPAVRTAGPTPAAPTPATRAADGTEPGTEVSSAQDTRWARAHPDDPRHEDRLHAVERVDPPREVSLSSRRIGEFEPDRESADLLTADRLLDPRHARRAEPEGAWQQFVFALTGGRINLGDGRRARDRKDLDRRISAVLPGGAKFVPVLSRKGGVGKTTVTTLLGMALADARDDRVIAVDANPDRGTLADRIARSSGRTVRDLVRRRDQIADFHELSAIVARDETRLDVLASDSDPRVSEAFSDRDYHDVASIAAHYYSIIVTDTGTGVVHSVMGATLDLANQIVVVAGLSVDEARLASEMLTWLDTNGYGHQVREAVVVLNNARPGSPLIRRDELERHFRSRVRAVVQLPYDPTIAAGSAISWRELDPATREAARAVAAEVVGGLRQGATAA